MEQALIGALNLVSRDLPLPPELFNTVSSICYGSDSKPLSLNAEVDEGNSSQDDDSLLTELQDAISKQRPNCSSSSKLNNAMKVRTQARFQNRLTQLEGLRWNWGDNLQTKCLLELYGLKVKLILESLFIVLCLVSGVYIC